MKSIYAKLFLACMSGLLSSTLCATNLSSDQEVIINKGQSSGSSKKPTPKPVAFYGTISMDELTLSVENYTGTIAVQVTGGSLIHVYTTSSSPSSNAGIDIGNLPEGIYTINIQADGKGECTGQFELYPE